MERSKLVAEDTYFQPDPISPHKDSYYTLDLALQNAKLQKPLIPNILAKDTATHRCLVRSYEGLGLRVRTHHSSPKSNTFLQVTQPTTANINTVSTPVRQTRSNISTPRQQRAASTPTAATTSVPSRAHVVDAETLTSVLYFWRPIIILVVPSHNHPVCLMHISMRLSY